MISRLGNRFGRARRGDDVAPPPAAAEPPTIEFSAFAEDCRIQGWIALTSDRLSDLLNGDGPLVLSDVLVQGLADGRTDEIAELTVARDELCAVVASGPGGDPGRRLRTQTTHVEVELGPYHIVGDLHGTPASNPLRTVLRRAAWVPLTGVTIAYRSGAEGAVEVVAALLLNRAMATSFRALDDSGYVALPWERQAAEPPTDAAGAPGDETAPG